MPAEPRVMPFTEWLAQQEEDRYICPRCRARYFHCSACGGTGIDNKRAHADYDKAVKAQRAAWERWNQQANP